MENPEDDMAEPSEDDLFASLTDALAGDVFHSASTPAATARDELDRRVHSLNFERDQAWSLMLTTLAGRDAAYAEGDATIIAKDTGIADRDADRAYADNVVAQARDVLERQDSIIRMAMTLLGRIDMLEQELRLASQTPETANYLALLQTCRSHFILFYCTGYIICHSSRKKLCMSNNRI